LKPPTVASGVRFAPAPAQISCVIIRRKSESPLASATIARKLAALLQHFDANEDESCRECGDRLNFVSVKPKMIF
jgi:hypothetical protein